MSKKQELTRKEIDKATDMKLYSAFRLVEKENLLYFRVLKKMNFIVEEKFKAIGAVGYDPKKNQVYMILQEDAMLKGSDEDIAGLCEHECGHVLYEHIFNQKPDIDHGTMNMAMDAIINDSCHYIVSRMNLINQKNSPSILAGGCFYSNFQKKFKKLENIPSDEINSLELYHIIKEEQEKNQDKQGQGKKNQKGQGQGGQGQPQQSQGQGQSQDGSGEGQPSDEQGQGNGMGQPFDSHDQFEIKEDANGNETVSKIEDKEKAKAHEKAIADAAKDALMEAIEQLRREGQLDKAIGQLKGQMKILVKDLIKSKTDKNSILNFMNRVVVGYKKKWTKLHRRYAYVAKGSRKNKKPKMGIVIDTSGSMGGDELFALIKHQCQVLANRCETLWIIVGDTQLEYSVFIKNKRSFKPETVEFKGGGGTDLQFGWDFAKEKKLDGLVVHTDGHIGEFDTHGVKTIFYLYGEGHREQEGFQNVRVYPA